MQVSVSWQLPEEIHVDSLNTESLQVQHSNAKISKHPRPLNTFFNTAQTTTPSSARHYMMTGGRAEGKAVGLPQRPGEDGGLCPDKWAPELGSTSREIWLHKKKKKKKSTMNISLKKHSPWDGCPRCWCLSAAQILLGQQGSAVTAGHFSHYSSPPVKSKNHIMRHEMMVFFDTILPFLWKAKIVYWDMKLPFFDIILLLLWKARIVYHTEAQKSGAFWHHSFPPM